MSDVTLTIDGRDVTVPAGTGLVEAAAELGVEIPVFCYEPRIGPPVGACRMCLVEIEGVPKLQAACATDARPGMVVSTVSQRARDAQEAVLEFLLVNHPLDCPVCDKGGECPLQDQAFRWGPGESRFTENKRVNDKPIPVSPLIALDRERCILCYRCTRFSAEVTEDLQLVARQRGANSVIATFEGRPWEGHHAGNVIELCPVGALTSTQYRFRARPWEAPDHPSVAAWDPLGSNTFNTVREGQIVRVLARRNDDVDNGWIDDRTRFAYASLYGPNRIRTVMHRPFRDRPVGNRPVVEQSMEVALEWLHEQLVSGDAQPLFVLSGSETLEVAYAATQLAAQTGGRVVAIPGASAAAPKASARISDLRGARHVLVIGDADLLDTAPGLDLWIRKARQAGAHVSVAGVGGTRIEAAGSTHELVKPGDLDAWVAQYTQRVSDAMGDHPLTEPGVIIYRDGELSAASQDLLAQTFAFPRDGSGFLAIPSGPNARGLAAIGIETAAWSDILSHTGGVVYFGVDPDRHVSVEQWGPSIKRARWVVCVDTLPTPLHAAADLVIPGAWAGEQDGTLVNLEGRLQRLTVGCEPPVKAPLQWLAGLVRRLGGKLPSHGAGAYRLLAGEVGENLPAPDHGSIPAGGVLGVTGGSAPIETPVTIPARGDDELALYVAPYLYDANEVVHADAMQFLRDDARVVMHREDARSRGLATGDHAIVTLDGDVDVLATVTTNRRIAAGHARIHAGTGDVPAGRTGWTVASVRAASIVLQSGNGEG